MFFLQYLRLGVLCLLCLFITGNAYATRLFIPMDADGQVNHLKAYGIAFAAVQKGLPASWLLNYKGGSFVIDDNGAIEKLCNERRVSFIAIDKREYARIEKEIKNGGTLYNIVQLEKVPRIAVYTPPEKKPWDDAVTLALTYADIPFDKIYADDVLNGALVKYDWLHLHHEDFTGQQGRMIQYRGESWYISEKQTMESIAARHGFNKVSKLQTEVVKKIRDFVENGGNLFAMCNATETFDIALAAENTDISDPIFDGDPIDEDYRSKLDFTKCLAFKDFMINTSVVGQRSTIDNFASNLVPEYQDTFNINVFPAQPDPVPAMLTQNHTIHIKGFLGQTSVFRNAVIKPGVLVLGGYMPTREQFDEAEASGSLVYKIHGNDSRYLHGNLGKGTWTFYSGHDPEDFQHNIGDLPTDLGIHPTSPGYRLILNNVLLHTVKRILPPDVTHPDASLTTVTPLNKQTIKQPRATTVESFSLYPTGDKLTVGVNPAEDGTRKGKIEKVVVTNVDGKEFISEIFNSETATVDVKSLSPGMYQVMVNGSFAGRFMKE
ncbi:MAG: T9SS type A sorting domain-containing protein [Bacteroidetes bacterium]|nr:T9SS type A sorting domain-containing protein [Bacteroidota bacterium]